MSTGFIKVLFKALSTCVLGIMSLGLRVLSGRKVWGSVLSGVYRIFSGSPKQKSCNIQHSKTQPTEPRDPKSPTLKPNSPKLL